MVLIIMEVLVINIRVLVFYVFRWLGLDVIYIYYLVFRVCERVLGLTILVLIIRYFGGDYYKTFRAIKF